MPKPDSAPSSLSEVVRPAAGLAPAAPPAPRQKEATGRLRPPAVRYLGFRTTEEGREYTLRVTDDLEPRFFVLFITHEAFAAHQARFQDAPDLCFRKLRRELLVDPDLRPGGRLDLTAEELLDYRDARERPASERKRRGSRG